MSAKDFKAKAAAAFQAGQWEEAIECYNQAITLDPNDTASIANRSVAYMKFGRLEDALKDGQQCRSLEPANSLGYLREASVLVAQRQYQQAMDSLQEGLENCHEKDHQQLLQSALRGAQRALLWQLPASVAARKMVAAFLAAEARQSTHGAESKVAPLMQVALTNKEDLLSELVKLGDTNAQQVLDIVFHFVLDQSSLSVIQAMGPAWKTAFASAENGSSNNLFQDPVTFTNAIQQVATKTQTTPTAAAALMVNAIVQKEAFATGTQHDKEHRTMALFSVLDKEGTSEVAFPDLAGLCYAWACDNLSDDFQAATKLLVMMNPDDTRTLDYPHFGKFLLSLASTWNLCLEDVLDDLVLTSAGTPRALTSEELQQITVGSNGSTNHSSKLDPLTYTRTKQLFQLWDTNGDGTIDFPELLRHLRRYQQATCVGSNMMSANAQAEKIALLIMGHDEDRNQTLDPEEFAEAMVDYAKAADTDLHQLIDFMCCVVGTSASEDSVAFEKAYSEAALTPKKTGKAYRQSFTMMAIADIEEGTSEEEEED